MRHPTRMRRQSSQRKGLRQVVLPRRRSQCELLPPQAVRDHALVTYMGEPYLAQSPDTCPSPDTIRYIVSGPSPDTIDTNLPCRIGIANRNVNVWGYIEGCMHVLWLCAASGQKFRGVWWCDVGSVHLHCSVVENHVLHQRRRNPRNDRVVSCTRR